MVDTKSMPSEQLTAEEQARFVTMMQQHQSQAAAREQWLGLALDKGSILEYPPAICLYGVPGIGKSTEMGRAFPLALYLCTHRTVLRPLASWIRLHLRSALQEGIVIPDRVTLPDVVNGKLYDPRAAIKHLANKIGTAKAQNSSPYMGIIIDEMTEMAARVHAVIRSLGLRNKFASYDMVKDFVREFGGLSRTYSMVVGMVNHSQDPEFDDDGELLIPGGPAFPFKAQREEIGGMLDLCWRLMYKYEPKKKENAKSAEDIAAAMAAVLNGAASSGAMPALAQPVAFPAIGQTAVVAAGVLNAGGTFAGGQALSATQVQNIVGDAALATGKSVQEATNLLQSAVEMEKMPDDRPAESAAAEEASRKANGKFQGAPRVYRTGGDPLWITKSRDFATDFEAEIGLRKHLLDQHYRLT